MASSIQEMSRPHNKATSDRQSSVQRRRKENMYKTWTRLILTVASLAWVPTVGWTDGIDDPSREATYQALAGKRVAFVPLGMGLDLTEAWAAGMKRQADELGYKFDIRDPNWS